MKTMCKGQGAASDRKMAARGGFWDWAECAVETHCLAKQIKGEIDTASISYGHMNGVTNQNCCDL